MQLDLQEANFTGEHMQYDGPLVISSFAQTQQKLARNSISNKARYR